MKRIVIIGAVGVVAILAALFLSQYSDREDGTETATQTATADGESAGSAEPAVEGAAPEPAPAEVAAIATESPESGATSSQGAPATAPSPAAAPPQGGPSFDVVRINPRGNAVIAGRAKPNSMVTVFEGEKEVGTVIADSRGEWVLLPEAPFDAGSRELTLSAKDESGKVTKSGQTVVLVIPDRKEETQPGQSQPSAVAVLVPNDGGGGTVLQPPGAEGDEGISQEGLSLDIIDYDEKGQVVVGGRAPVGASVQVYIDNELVGGVVADSDGRWQVKPEKAVAPGLHTLRVDQVAAPDGKVVARVETPFSRASFAEAEPGSIVVQPGNSLWRIARRTYGEGLRYSLIFEANKDQIRDPDLIYPGQVFSLPKQQP